MVVADSSPFIHLDRIGRLDLLFQVFGQIEVPQAIMDEVLAGGRHGAPVPDLAALPWITVVPNLADPEVLLQPDLHAGEIAALSVARARVGSLLIVDDLAGRNAAAKLGLRFIGTAGTVIRAKRTGIIAAAAPVLNELAAHGFRLSIDIRLRLLEQVGER